MKVFNAIDENQSGHIDFNELVRQVMGKDISAPQFYEVRAREAEDKARALKAAGPVPRVLKSWPTSLAKNPLKFDELLRLFQTKIVERTKRPSGT